MKKTVPLVTYDESGERKVLGSAEVEYDPDNLDTVTVSLKDDSIVKHHNISTLSISIEK